MKKATLIIWVIIFGFIALIIFQNQEFFLAKNSFVINLGVVKEYLSPELPNAVLILIFFFSGLIIAYLFSFSARFRAKRTIKKLNINIASHINELAELKREVDALKGVEPPVDEQADTVKLDLSAVQKLTDENAAKGSADKTLKFDAAPEASNPSENSEESSDEKKS